MKVARKPQPGLTPSSARERAVRTSHMQALVERIQKIEERLRQGGGPERVAKQHKAGKLTARERIGKLIDRGFVLPGDRPARCLGPL